MAEHSSYHQAIPGGEAERRLKESGRHNYLTRFSDNHNTYILTVHEKQVSSDVIRHFKININEKEKRCTIIGKEASFDNIHALLNHYEMHRIDPALRSIGRNYSEADYKEDRRGNAEQVVIPIPGMWVCVSGGRGNTWNCP
jgi:hypothetical protein